MAFFISRHRNYCLCLSRCPCRDSGRGVPYLNSVDTNRKLQPCRFKHQIPVFLCRRKNSFKPKTLPCLRHNGIIQRTFGAVCLNFDRRLPINIAIDMSVLIKNCRKRIVPKQSSIKTAVQTTCRQRFIFEIPFLSIQLHNSERRTFHHYFTGFFLVLQEIFHTSPRLQRKQPIYSVNDTTEDDII